MASTATTSEPTVHVAAGPAAARRTLLFRVGPTVYGCDIDDIREIVPHRRATRLPGAPAFVQGLINLRGTIVTVLDLAVRLETGLNAEGGRADGRAPTTDGSIMLVQVAGAGGSGSSTRTVGIAVHEVMDVRVIRVEQGDAVVSTSDATVVRGLAHIDGSAVILLDVHALVRQVLLS